MGRPPFYDAKRAVASSPHDTGHESVLLPFAVVVVSLAGAAWTGRTLDPAWTGRNSAKSSSGPPPRPKGRGRRTWRVKETELGKEVWAKEKVKKTEPRKGVWAKETEPRKGVWAKERFKETEPRKGVWGLGPQE
jgi:hypothetical protein